MLAFYTVVSVVMILIANGFFPIFGQGYSWWLVPVLLAGLLLVWILLHSIVFVLWVCSTSLEKPVTKDNALFRRFSGWTLDEVLRLARVKIEVDGAEKIPQDQRFLLVCNHRTQLDPAFLMSALPNAELAFIGKKEIYTDMPFVARAMHRLSGLPIDRENNRAAIKTIVAASEMLKEDRVSVGIFPEGYTNLTQDILLPFRNGCFKIASKAGVPVVVCTLWDTKVVYQRMFRKKTVLQLDVLAVLDSQESTAEIGEKAERLMRENLARRSTK
ncbi:MAG: 1-acyl-sn-glycerol-3-phosphate acyltransferase [Clostridia bacterium]|nr:1-acyl-sn-glycerol-3-phosphate acyltransferase [Clostridia bacterium]